jgi:hypothetical protein
MPALLTRSLGKGSLKTIRYIHRTPEGASSGLYPPTENLHPGLMHVNPEPWARGGLRGVVGPLGIVGERHRCPLHPLHATVTNANFLVPSGSGKIEAGGPRNAKVDLGRDGEQRGEGDAMENAHRSVQSL